ncbi:MAG: TraB/GumN family protein [Betaproteobacteria bacterium]|nr:TraB/GumN family protein [Betaproteobacteria bacterium]
MRFLLRGLLLLLVLWETGFAWGSSSRYGPEPPDTIVAPQAGVTPPAAAAKSFLWEVRSQTNTIYLFGTIHVGKPNFYPLPPAVEEALKQSTKLVLEADVSNSTGMEQLLPLMMFNPPDSLEKAIPPALFARTKQQLARYGIPAEAANRMKPVTVVSLLLISSLTEAGYDAKAGVELYLLDKAKQDNKPVLELESQRGQLLLLNSLSATERNAFLSNAITTLERGNVREQLDELVTAWQSGNSKLMQETAAKANKGMLLTSQLDNVIIYGRHNEMVKKLERFLEGSEPHFVAVGAFHLLGKRGLVELLKAKGYKVRQL